MKITAIETLVCHARMRNWIFVKVITDQPGLSGQLMNGDAKMREALRQMIPVKELIAAEDVARSVAFLCDPDKRQMIGSVIVQDGGMSLLAPKL